MIVASFDVEDGIALVRKLVEDRSPGDQVLVTGASFRQAKGVLGGLAVATDRVADIRLSPNAATLDIDGVRVVAVPFSREKILALNPAVTVFVGVTSFVADLLRLTVAALGAGRPSLAGLADCVPPMNPSCRTVRLREVTESGDQRFDREWEGGTVDEVLELYRGTV